MSNWLTSITDHLHQLTHRLHSLLAPPGATCLTCGTRAILSPIYPAICPRCVQQIPWIRSIRCLRCGRGIGCPDCVRPHMQNRSFIFNRSAVQYNALMKEWIGMYKFRGHERYAPLLTALMIQAFQAMNEELNPVLAKETPAPVAHPDAAPHHRQPLLQNNKPRWRPDAVTYVPVSNERLAERGFNQAERLAAGLAAAVRLPVVDLLQRRINTTKQSFKTRGERIQTMQDAFAMQPDGLELMLDLYQANAQFRHKDMHSQPATNSYAIGKGVSSHISSTTQGWQASPLRLLMIDDIYTTGSTLDACGQVILNAGYSMNIPIEIYTLTLARS